MAYSECLPTLLNPLAERTCFSQVSTQQRVRSMEPPTTKVGTRDGIFMVASKAAKADTSATCVFSMCQGAQVSAHRDKIFLWPSISNRRLLIGSAYAGEGNTFRIAHALSIKTNATPNTDFIIAADWNDTLENAGARFADAQIPAVAVIPDGPTCLSGDSSLTIDFVITSSALAPASRCNATSIHQPHYRNRSPP